MVNTPNLDAWASRSLVFDRHFARFPHVPFAPMAGLNSILIDDRREPGNPLGFERVVRTDPQRHATPGKALLAALKSLRLEEPWFVSIETDRLLPPWDFEFETYQQYAEGTAGFMEHQELPAPIDEPALGPSDDMLWHRLRNSFAAAVTSFDAEIGLILKWLGSREAMMLFTSNAGFSLGEHGIVGPAGSRMHEELVHVPLWIQRPGERGSRTTRWFEPTDERSVLGHSELPSKQKFFITQGDERLVRTDEWAYLPANTMHPARLYLKPDDLWEANDVSQAHPDVCEEMEALLSPAP